MSGTKVGDITVTAKVITATLPGWTIASKLPFVFHNNVLLCGSLGSFEEIF